jgi:hypothetical protein
MTAVPLRPSLVAVTVAVPAATAVTVPEDDTVATDAALEVQDTERPVSVSPEALVSFALSATVAPTPSVAVAGVTVTAATAAGWTDTSTESRSVP